VFAWGEVQAQVQAAPAPGPPATTATTTTTTAKPQFQLWPNNPSYEAPAAEAPPTATRTTTTTRTTTATRTTTTASGENPPAGGCAGERLPVQSGGWQSLEEFLHDDFCE
jgi:hypothetical protein